MPLAVSSTVDSAPTRAAALPRLRVGKLCIAVQGATPAELFARAEAALKDSVFIEFRLDFLPKPAAALPDLKAFLTRRRDVTAIATCRRKSFGGQLHRLPELRAGNPPQSRRNRLPHRRSRSRVGRAVHPPATGQVPRRPPRRRHRPSSSVRTTSPAPAAPRASSKPPSASPPSSPSSSKSSPPRAAWPTTSPSCT